jgi:hypothetical protein
MNHESINHDDDLNQADESQQSHDLNHADESVNHDDDDLNHADEPAESREFQEPDDLNQADEPAAADEPDETGQGYADSPREPGPPVDELRRCLRQAGIWGISVDRLAEIARANGRDSLYLQEWTGWLSRDPAIYNPAAYLAKVIRLNSDLPAQTGRPNSSPPYRDNRPPYREQRRDSRPPYRDNRPSYREEYPGSRQSYPDQYREEYRRRTERLAASARKYGREV